MTIYADRPPARAGFQLEDRFRITAGKVFLTGVQAVCRVPLDLRRVDARHGMKTRAFVSGYQGSPLGTLDFAFRAMREEIDAHGVDFQPGVNELLAATAVQGTQSVPSLGSDVAGVTGYWYGKAPGVDQALDAIRHGNLMGTHPSGGVVAFVGDDATAKSSTVPCGSETVLRAALVPVLAPADSHDVLELGLHAATMSRSTGLWTSLKVATAVADGSSVAAVDLDRFDPVIPRRDGDPYRHEVMTYLAAQLAVGMEQNLHEVRLPLARAYGYDNQLNKILRGGPEDKLGIVAAGKTYLEVRQALSDLGLDDAELARLGIRLLKIGMVWPMEPRTLREFADGLEEVLVVEDKGPFLEHLVKDVLFDMATRPQVFGSQDGDGRPLFPAFGEVGADTIGKALAQRILARGEVASVRARLRRLTEPARTLLPLTVTKRTPYFCSGCPHNRSTKLPDGSLVGGGIGCHAMVGMMEPEQTGTVTGLTQMGGEGAQWIGQQPYTHATHIFQNLGDGTLAHSGLLAIRANVAAGTNVTYKILYNATVAMTGGQDVQGGYRVPQLAATLASEGVTKIVVTTDDTTKYRGDAWPKIAEVRSRDDLLTVQEELRDTPGVTVLIHDQACAAELRRKRKRGTEPDPAMRVVINERICEGCGDCGRVSNCLSVVPAETEFGRKTRIHQASCNKDYSCIQGDCPSFLEVIPDPGRTKQKRRAPAIDAAALPLPKPLAPADGFSLRITGVGGTGVVTVAQVIATAAFIDGYSPRGLDQIGLSQKAGPVVSDIKFSSGDREWSNRVGTAGCDLYLGCDVLVASDASNLAVADPARTIAVVSTAEVPTGSMIRRPDTAFPDQSPLLGAIDARTRQELNAYLDGRDLAERLFGGDQFMNMVLVGVAYQAGGLPLTEQAIERAIELNGVATEANRQAFRRGRQAVADPGALATTLDELVPTPPKPAPPSAEAIEIINSTGAEPAGALADSLRLRVPDLIAYQNAGYARRYAEVISQVLATEAEKTPGSTRLTEAVAFSLHKLMAYKDEYETARLALDENERAKIRAQYGDKAKVTWQLHPPILRAMGLRKKLSLGRWFTVFFVILRWAKWLRGSRLDLFGYAKVRRTERALIEEYLEVVDEIIGKLESGNHQLAVQVAELPDVIRGYEHIKLGNVEKYHEQLAELRGTLAAV